MGAVLVAAFVAVPGVASAGGAPAWEIDRYPGVDYATFTRESSQVYATRVNLCAPGVRMRATAPGEGPRQVASFGELVGASVAVNGDWWAVDGGPPDVPQTTYPRGLAIGDGMPFPGLFDHESFGVVGFGKDFAFHSIMEENLGTGNFFMQDVVSGQPTLVWDGALRDNPNAHCGATRARTSVGFSADNTVVYLVVVQETGGSTGVTCNQMGSIMQYVGAHSALNQDGGGSSTMWLAGVGVVNGLTDGSPRTLVNHWGVMTAGSGPPNSCATRVIPAPAGGVARHITSPADMAAWRFADADVRLIGPDTLATYPVGAPWPATARLLKGTGPEVWVVDGESKRHVPNPYALLAWRLHEVTIEPTGDDVLAAMPTGSVLPETPSLVLGPDFSIQLLDVAPPGGGGGGGGDGGGGGPGSPDGGGGGGAGEDGGASGGCTIAAAPASSSRAGAAWGFLGLVGLLGLARRRQTSGRIRSSSGSSSASSPPGRA